jgi:hypothetical protein
MCKVPKHDFFIFGGFKLGLETNRPEAESLQGFAMV